MSLSRTSSAHDARYADGPETKSKVPQGGYARTGMERTSLGSTQSARPQNARSAHSVSHWKRMQSSGHHQERNGDPHENTDVIQPSQSHRNKQRTSGENGRGSPPPETTDTKASSEDKTSPQHHQSASVLKIRGAQRHLERVLKAKADKKERDDALQ